MSIGMLLVGMADLLAEAGEAVGEPVACRIERAERDDGVLEEAEGAVAIIAAPALDEIAERDGRHAQTVAAVICGVNRFEVIC